MTSRHFLAIIGALFIAASQHALAEITFCNGTWTNRGCDGTAKEVLPEMPAPPVESQLENVAELNQKSFLYRDLDLLVAKTTRSYGIRVDVSDARDICYSKTTTVEHCRRAVADGELRVTAKIQDARVIGSPAGEAKKQGERSNTTVIVNNNEGDIFPTPPSASTEAPPHP